MTAATETSVLEALAGVEAPGAEGKSIVQLGYVKDVTADRLKVEFPGPLTPARQAVEQACQAALQAKGISARVELVQKIPASYVSDGKQGGLAPGVKNFVAVGSGKGGVGKSTLSANIACGLATAGARVGLLDVDVYGPSVPLLFGISQQAWQEEMDELARAGKVDRNNPQLIPFERHGVKTMSLGYLIDDSKAAIWRGPMVHGAITQLLRDVAWGELDYLIMDMPPGTGDAQLTITQSLPLAGAVIVCTPQPVALSDAKKACQMFETTKTELLGLVENMSGPVFGEGGAKDAAHEWGLPYLGTMPLDAAVRTSGDQGIPLLAQAEAAGPLADALWGVVDRLTTVLAGKAKAKPRSLPIRRS